MNFTTDLPKKNPLVSYIVASAVRCEKFFSQTGNKQQGQNEEDLEMQDQDEGPVYRMHAVILKSQQLRYLTNLQK